MNLLQIEYFLAASEKLNFTAAAEKLYISQPALSKQIKLLENELGVKLFVRNKKRITLTDAGYSFRKDLENVIQNLEQAVEKVRTFSSIKQNLLRIGCFKGPAAEDIILSVSKKIAQEAPETKIVFHRNGLKQMREALKNDDVDVIITLDFEMPDLLPYHSKSLFTANSAFVYSENSPLACKDALSFDDFREIPLLLEDKAISEGAYRSALSLMKNLGIVNPKIEFYDSWETLITYIKMGHGFCIMYENACYKISGLKQLLINQIDSSRSIVAVWKHDNFWI